MRGPVWTSDFSLETGFALSLGVDESGPRAFLRGRSAFPFLLHDEVFHDPAR